MQTIIRYPDAQRFEALVLSLGPDTMRLLAPGAEDTIELQLWYGEWRDETGVPVEFESFLTGSSAEAGDFLAAAQLCASA